MDNKLCKNRKSPTDEAAYIQAYLNLNPTAKKKDGLDIAAVVTKDGVKGHGLLDEEINRSHDTGYHRVKSFIPDNVLKQKK